jgi:hypothetical protein
LQRVKFNAGSLSGFPRSKEKLINKFKNMKKKYKTEVAKEKKDLKATGGGPFQGGSSSSSLDFGLSQTEVMGISNPLDSNGEEIPCTIDIYEKGYEVSSFLILYIYLKTNYFFLF